MTGTLPRSLRFLRILALPFLLGTILLTLAVSGSPPTGPLATARLAPGGESPPAGDGPADALKAIAASQSTLESVVYPQWQRRYLENGGDRNAIVGLWWTRGMSTEPSMARGSVKLDLIGGSVIAHVQGLGDQPADLWLVDNSDGPGMSSLPEPGDRMVRVGRLEKSGTGARLSAELGPKFFPGFEPDTLVVSRADSTPADSRILLGSRDFFERVYTKTRLEVERSRPRGFRVFLASLLSPRDAHADSTQVLISHKLVSKAVGDGADLFFRQTFNGNGRTCGTCHRVENNLVVEAAFIATLPPSDPIFVAERPADQGGVPGLERPQLMRKFGLILENVDGFENPVVKFVMRGVPHTLSVATSVTAPITTTFENPKRSPVERPGWSGDGAPSDLDPTKTGALRLFPNGAIEQHFPKTLNRVRNVDFRLATDAELDNMRAYMLATGRTNELDLNQVTMSDASAELGRRIFKNSGSGNPNDPNNDPDPTIGAGKCFFCHLNAGANVRDTDPKKTLVNVNFNTGVERVPHLARRLTENFTSDGGFGRNANDCNADTINDCFGDLTFNTPPLVEAADTPPFFHNNVVRDVGQSVITTPTIEDAVAFYSSDEFRNSPSGGLNINLNAEQNLNVGAFLRAINAAFNADMAIQRNDNAIKLENSQPIDSGCGGGDPGTTGDGFSTDATCTGGTGGEDPGKRATVDRLLALSNEEAQDAIDVLSKGPRSLHPDAVTLLQSAISKNNQAIASNQSQQRKDLMLSALNDLKAARGNFATGTGLTMTMGEGNLLF